MLSLMMGGKINGKRKFMEQFFKKRQYKRLFNICQHA